jgi:hypothetical protein
MSTHTPVQLPLPFEEFSETPDPQGEPDGNPGSKQS